MIRSIDILQVMGNIVRRILHIFPGYELFLCEGFWWDDLFKRGPSALSQKEEVGLYD